MSIRRDKKIFKYPGFFLKGETFRLKDSDKEDHTYAIVGGEIIRRVSIRTFKNGSQQVDFAVRYAAGGYVVCQTWGDSPIVEEAKLLEQFARVFVCGTIHHSKYKNKYGEDRERWIMAPFLILPLDKLVDMMHFASRMMNSPSLDKLLEKDEIDGMESAGDFGIGEENDIQDDDEDLFV